MMSNDRPKVMHLVYFHYTLITQLQCHHYVVYVYTIRGFLGCAVFIFVREDIRTGGVGNY